MTPLGFDSLIIHHHHIDAAHISNTLLFFSNLGIKNFIFLFNYDPIISNTTAFQEKLKSCRKQLFLIKNSVRLRINIFLFPNIILTGGYSSNPSFDKLYANRSFHSVFLSLPWFLDDDANGLSYDINHILYKKKAFPIFTDFDSVYQTSSPDLCDRLLSNRSLGISVDLNHVFSSMSDTLLKKGISVIPQISNELSNYVGILNYISNFKKKCGMIEHFNICRQIKSCSEKIL